MLNHFLIVYRYEYVYGINPFTNQNYKIMQMLIKRYPVVFPDETPKKQSQDIMDIGMDSVGGLAEPMPHEFHDLIRDLLSKDPRQRLGSEEFLSEFLNHPFFQNY